MKIKTFGAKHFTGQLPRIEEGFKELGHEIVDSSGVNLVYANDENGAREAVDWLSRTSDYPKVIFNCLDIPEHLFPNYDLKESARIYQRADYITAISQTTKEQLRQFLRIPGGKIKIIYQPTMPLPKPNNKYNFKYLLVGRQNDFNKRAKLFYEYWQIYDKATQVCIVGSENPGFGTWVGIVSTQELSNLYNSTPYVFCGGKYEGIQLPLIEKLIAGNGFPIGMNDCSASMEFAHEFCCDPNSQSIAEKVLELNNNAQSYTELQIKYQKQYAIQFDSKSVASKILNLVKV